MLAQMCSLSSPMSDDRYFGPRRPLQVPGHQVPLAASTLEEVAELGLLCRKVSFVVRIGCRANGKLFNDFKIVTFEPNDLAWIVCEQADLADTQINEDLRSKAVVAEIYGESQLFVGLNGIKPLFLEFVGMDLGREPNASAFLAHINKNACPGLFNLRECLVQL
jgi:hypothetical protein